MLTENFIAAIQAVNKPSAHLSSNLRDVGIVGYEFQPQCILREGFKKSSVKPNCLAISDAHIYAAQADKAVIHVYNRAKGNQEATVPFPDKIHSLAYANEAAILAIGTEDGKIVLWEIGTGRISVSAASHLEPISSLVITKNNEHIVSGSAENSIHVWSLPRLVEFPSTTESYSEARSANAPIRTFSNHRAGTTAIDVGHSNSRTNFVVSAAADLTCYLWHLETAQVLRTFLVHSIPVSLTIDPADRSIYLGNEDGTIQSIDLFGNSKESIYNTTTSAPVQLTRKTCWTTDSSDMGAAQCLTLSYDGTILISGHAGGRIITWDTAKRKMITDITNLQQPITNIQMLIPEALRDNRPNFIIPSIVKPRLDLNAESTKGTIGLPASYSLSAQVTRPPPTNSLRPNHNLEMSESILSGSPFPQSMLDDAIYAMAAKSMGLTSSSTTSSTTHPTPNADDKHKIQTLLEEKKVLEQKVAVLQKIHRDSQDRHRRRNEQREKIGKQRREAYFTAKKKGKDGDEAMKRYDEKLEELDELSDAEELEVGENMDLDGNA